MIISKENRYIFIAVPKTGTTSIQKLLLENDPTARNYGIKIDGKRYNFGTHDTALRISSILGDLYTQFRTFGFIRNPYSRIVSSYFFYKNGNPIKPGNKNPWPHKLRIAYARTIPFKFWALSYPYKSNIEHLVDENGKLMVDFVGTFENLKEDFTKIVNSIGLDVPVDDLRHTNKSNHTTYGEYFPDGIFKNILDKKMSSDLEFYDRYKFNL